MKGGKESEKERERECMCLTESESKWMGMRDGMSVRSARERSFGRNEKMKKRRKSAKVKMGEG